MKKIKDEIRKEFSAKRDAISEAERIEKSEKICSIAKELVSFRHAEVILLYSPIKSEIDVLPIAEYALSKGKAIAFPRCNTEDRTMKFHFVTSLDQLKEGAYGIKEPTEDAPVYDPEEDKRVAVCYVPGLTFDVYGYRLGYGKGYYDKFMDAFKGSTIGVAYTSQILPALPKGRFDKHCDALITEKGIKPLKQEKR
jgi:5-formyltetrahydrofolate cyclo-ligase